MHNINYVLIMTSPAKWCDAFSLQRLWAAPCEPLRAQWPVPRMGSIADVGFAPHCDQQLLLQHVESGTFCDWGKWPLWPGSPRPESADRHGQPPVCSGGGSRGSRGRAGPAGWLPGCRPDTWPVRFQTRGALFPPHRTTRTSYQFGFDLMLLLYNCLIC